MEMPSSNCPNAKDDDLTLILAQIKQYNESVKDALEESHPQNHQDFKELMCLLIPLIRDLSKSLCAKLSGTTETLQNTLHILKELQEKFKDLNTTNDYINYLIMVKQILEDTEGSLKLSEEHLENIDAESKLLANENYNNDAALRINSEHINGIAKSEENVITTDSSEFSEDTSQERKIETNVQREEPDNLIKINDNTDETNEPECMDKNRFSVTEEQAHLHNTNITCEQIINPQPEQRRENAEEPSSSEVIVNGTRHKADCLSDSGAWTYKEFTLQDDEGSFAEVKVYKLGTFSVVSCLKKEKFNVLKKGLSLKLSVDSRISLNYPPGCFSSSVIVQFKVQPIDTSLISVLKAKHDIYHPVVSSSPLIQVKQPSVQAFHKPVTVFLPCPPNPEKKKTGDDAENRRAASAAGSKTTGTHQIRAVSASVRKHGDNPSELLKLLALKEDQWIILDDIVVKNVQNGLVSLEVTEYMQRFIVVRLSSAMDNTHLIKFIQSLEYAIYSSMVNVVLYRKNNNFNKVIAELVPSKELNWEINALMEAGYTGPPEPSEAIILQEGDQIHFTFCGNIAASDVKESGKTFKLTFHSQRMQKKCMDISVVDEFGNYSSPHFKGTVAFYKISKEEITEGYKSGLSTDNYIQQRTPVCKLSVTLPKVEKNISRPSSTKLLTVGPKDMLWDSVLKWVAQELSEEDAAELLHSLPIRRSTIQLVRLKSPNNLTNQIYELLSLWKKRLPTSTDKFRLLGRHLQKSGRSDLVEQMKVKWEPNMLGLATL
ncbi:death domain-containing protein 1 isoform X2 [Ranitomeya imitator]|uniref:death domain-containing protein 1 isoform X2 n=1 Tax=Ranitomeya imitator TaxID=111125 RepID=UPI0037E7E0B7